MKNDDSSQPATGGMPRWVKVCGLVVAVLVLAIGILHATGHGLGGHTP
jgi:hypothetical protein